MVEIAKAFIAHTGETKSLHKLKDFLDALGIECLIAETEPSNGRLVEQQVTWTYEQADFAIILATKSVVISKYAYLVNSQRIQNKMSIRF